MHDRMTHTLYPKAFHNMKPVEDLGCGWWILELEDGEACCFHEQYLREWTPADELYAHAT